MIRIPKSVVSVGALALVAGALTLAVPRAAHAVAATLVQVGNPPASPANTEDTSRQANQLVQLNCGAVNNLSGCALTGTTNDYTVPGGQSLVITSVELIPEFSSNNPNNSATVDLVGQYTGTVFHQWLVGGTTTNSVEFQYPSGIVLPPGTLVDTYSGINFVMVQLNGYLTVN